MGDLSWATASPQPALALRVEPLRVSSKAFDQAHLERCEYCGCNINFCGCDDAFSFEQIRDHPELMGHTR